mgnify:CR=1 FL=1
MAKGADSCFCIRMTPKQNDPQQRIHLGTKKTITICVIFESGTKKKVQFVSFFNLGQGNYAQATDFEVGSPRTGLAPLGIRNQ